jgi:hypothetical protein
MAVLELLREKNGKGENKNDYVLWIDADAYFNNFDERIEKYFLANDEQLKKDFIISDDKPYGNGRVNSGVFLVKNTEWSRNFLQKIWHNAGDYLKKNFYEQSVIGDYYNKNLLESQKHILILPTTEINNSNPNSTTSFICHMMSKPAEYRIFFASRKLNSLKP